MVNNYKEEDRWYFWAEIGTWEKNLAQGIVWSETEEVGHKVLRRGNKPCGKT